MRLKSRVTEKLTIIYIKVSHCMERNKLNMYISTLEREIQDIKLQIGIVCYDRWKNTRLRVEDIEELLKIIDAKNEEIEKQKELILQLSEQEKRILGKTGPVVVSIPSASAPAVEWNDAKGVKNAENASDANNEQQLPVLDLCRYHG